MNSFYNFQLPNIGNFNNTVSSKLDSFKNNLVIGCNLVSRKLKSHLTGAKSLYLFILIIYKLKNFFENKNLINDKNYLKDIKNNILDCGCISVKFTQWIVSKLKGSSNNDIYENIIEELEELFDNCKYHDLKYTKEIFKKSMGTDLEKVIDMESIQVIASGSIGQVYKAKFKKNNKFNYNDDIVIKVKHPELEYIKSYQMIIINFLRLLQKNNYLKNKLKLHINFSDFIDNINRQIDFRIEAQNCNKFYKDYYDNEYVVIPRIFTYSRDIIISSFEDGEYFYNISEYQKNKVAINLLALVSNMVLITNYIHGDMHIKNWKVRKYKNNYQLILYDFGICFNGPYIEYNRELWSNGERQNVKEIISLIIKHTQCRDNKKELIENLMKEFFKYVKNLLI